MARADGGLCSRETFGPCGLPGITPYIRTGHNAATRPRGAGRDGGVAAPDQLGGGTTDPKEFALPTGGGREAGRREWKKRVRYGKRWLSEMVTSSFKRLFGDPVAARRRGSATREISPKAGAYNSMLRMQREAMAMT